VPEATPVDEALAAGRAALARGAWREARFRYEEALAQAVSTEAWEGLSWAAWWLEDVPACLDAREHVELAYAMARFMLLASGMSAIETEALIFDARRGEPGTTPTRFVEIPILEASPVVGQRLADLALPPGSLVVKILRGGEVIVPGGQTAICADDVLFVLTDVGQARAIEHLVNPSSPQVR
jgi:hypothetical protein